MDKAFLKKLDKKHTRGIESKKSWYGVMFITPWLIGMLLFFFIPLFQSLLYSFGYVFVEPGAMQVEYFTTDYETGKEVLVGFEHYKYLFNEDPDYTNNLETALGEFFRSLPIIVVVSLILALVLNQKFKGRVFFRAIFFLPVIIATGVVMEKLTASYGGVGAIVQVASETSNVYTEGGGGGMDFTAILQNLNLPEDITNEMSKLITNIFNTLWSCGIPVILFISGLQTIPESLYEASHVEGATKWEEFWYITIPMLGNTILLVIVFTIIELLTQNTNPVLKEAYNQMSNMVYDLSAAMLWIFFVIIGAVIGIIIFLYNQFLLKKWN